MPGSPIPVIRQPFAPGDRLPFWVGRVRRRALPLRPRQRSDRGRGPGRERRSSPTWSSCSGWRSSRSTHPTTSSSGSASRRRVGPSLPPASLGWSNRHGSWLPRRRSLRPRCTAAIPSDQAGPHVDDECGAREGPAEHADDRDGPPRLVRVGAAGQRSTRTSPVSVVVNTVVDIPGTPMRRTRSRDAHGEGQQGDDGVAWPTGADPGTRRPRRRCHGHAGGLERDLAHQQVRCDADPTSRPRRPPMAAPTEEGPERAEAGRHGEPGAPAAAKPIRRRSRSCWR